MSEIHLIQSIRRAIKAEEKQGHINTGAIGGFSGYLLDALSELEIVLSAEELSRVKRMGAEYSRLSPLKRRSVLTELRQIIETAAQQFNEERTQDVAKPNEKAPLITVEKTVLKAQRDLQYIKGVGPLRAKQFENLSIYTVEDLLRHYPRKYEYRSKRNIADLKDGDLVTVTGMVTGSQMSRGRIKVIKLSIEQDGRSIHAVWFNQVHILKQFPVGTEVSVTGKVQWKKRIPELLATEIIKGESEGPSEQLVPVYPETARLNSKLIRSVIKTVLPQAETIFPETLQGETELMGRAHAYQQIHQPLSQEDMVKARERLVIEEVLFLQLAIARLRAPRQTEASPALKTGGELVNQFIDCLPFQFTNAQTRVIKEIFSDMEASDKAMTRLVQGDVGSGKTAVAMSAILQAVGSGFQAAMMAPTEVLAQQHYESLEMAFETLGVNVALLVGSQSKSEREQILVQIFSGKAHVVVGTHALIQDTVRFNALGLVVTDEQHRFGVRQRTRLQNKGENPHVLVMTATPIPRTLALTLYGDLQLSVLDEMPPGRKPVITKKISERNRPSLEKFLQQQTAAGRQIYVVCPLVEETEKSDLVSATQTAETIKTRFPESAVALLHGRMKSQEKETIMHDFRHGKIDILVATTVIEVGVNVPNASVMVVEGAERFGLAQLHQLRGRVGRGNEQSYCILISNGRDSTRLNILCSTEDGFKIAEEDLKIRGPGELLGLRQHGVPELKLTDLSRDGIFVERAHRILQRVLEHPEQHERLFKEVNRLYPNDQIGVN